MCVVGVMSYIVACKYRWAADEVGPLHNHKKLK
jgi:hypothetical protein